MSSKRLYCALHVNETAALRVYCVVVVVDMKRAVVHEMLVRVFSALITFTKFILSNESNFVTQFKNGIFVLLTQVSVSCSLLLSSS